MHNGTSSPCGVAWSQTNLLKVSIPTDTHLNFETQHRNPLAPVKPNGTLPQLTLLSYPNSQGTWPQSRLPTDLVSWSSFFWASPGPPRAPITAWTRTCWSSQEIAWNCTRGKKTMEYPTLIPHLWNYIFLASEKKLLVESYTEVAVQSLDRNCIRFLLGWTFEPWEGGAVVACQLHNKHVKVLTKKDTLVHPSYPSKT